VEGSSSRWTQPWADSQPRTLRLDCRPTEGGWRTRRATCLFPRVWRNPREQWVSDPEAAATDDAGFLLRGYAQIRKAVGDCMEEDIDELSQRAGELGLLGYQCSFSRGARAKGRALSGDLLGWRGAPIAISTLPRLGSCASFWPRLRSTRLAAARPARRRYGDEERRRDATPPQTTHLTLAPMGPWFTSKGPFGFAQAAWSEIGGAHRGPGNGV
jgi:hypothetical protein